MDDVQGRDFKIQVVQRSNMAIVVIEVKVVNYIIMVYNYV
jgi:hypothetical protein